MYHSHLGFRFRGQITPLEHEESYKDLGVTFDEKLSFRDHIHDKVHKAYAMLGIIKRNFKYIISINSFINAVLAVYHASFVYTYGRPYI